LRPNPEPEQEEDNDETLHEDDIAIAKMTAYLNDH